MAERNLNDVALAKLISRTSATVGNWRLKKREPSFADQDALAEVFQVPVMRFYADPTDRRTVSLPTVDFYEAATSIAVEAFKRAKEGQL